MYKRQLYLLIEHSFHTNTAAAKWLSQDGNLEKLADAEAELLAEHFGVTAGAEGRTAIMGEVQATAGQMALFCRSKNPAPKLTACSLEELAEMFLEEGKMCIRDRSRPGAWSRSRITAAIRRSARSSWRPQTRQRRRKWTHS